MLFMLLIKLTYSNSINKNNNILKDGNDFKYNNSIFESRFQCSYKFNFSSNNLLIMQINIT